MINSPILSIITICKDDLDGFCLTLNALRPLASSIELIIVVSCHCDLLYKYKHEASFFDHVKLIANQDRGLYNAMNIGLQHKQYDNPFIFMNGGDMLYPHSADLLARSAETICSREIHCFETFRLNTATSSSYSYDYIVDRKLDALEATSLGSSRGLNNGLYGQLIFHLFFFPCHQSILYGANLGTLRFDESLRISSDVFFNSRAFRQASRLKFSNEFLCLFDGSGLSTKSSRSDRLKDRIYGLRRHPSCLLDLRVVVGTVFLMLQTIREIFNGLLR